ncbi:MAG: HD domain-containing protein [Sulfuricurvum sp.]|nr:HD domain-containing protein [Sulfuricurvum sp.]MDP3023415.1 HD domain-containing protein [Sulfuricurvum sp.]MDP3119520.1 HD domain-containing protein [Sulfuricurvum sp.]
MIKRYPALEPLIEHLALHNITPILVGGCVRDHLLGHESLDIDIELYGVSDTMELAEILKPFGKINEVGKSFGVYKFRYGTYFIDLSLPRTENKSAKGHKGFEIQTYSDLDFATASRRRDFTINAMGYNPLTQTLLDPHNGADDLRKKRLVCVDPLTFVQDPLRLLRAVQFVARFDLTCDPKLLALCKRMIDQGALEELPKERIFEELKKLFLLSPKPSIGMELLREMGALPFFTPLDLYEKTPQDPLSHPEGNVWIHTLKALDIMALLRIGEPKRDITRMFAVLLHDCAKPITTVIENGKINAPHHALIGVEVGQKFLEKITNEHDLIASVLPLIRYHGAVRKLYDTPPSEILHLSAQVCIEDLIPVAEADFLGRGFNGTTPASFPAGEWLYAQASELGVLSSPPQPLIMGRDLISLGLSPDERFKEILENAYKAQLNQQFFTKDEAITWIKEHLVTIL